MNSLQFTVCSQESKNTQRKAQWQPKNITDISTFKCGKNTINEFSHTAPCLYGWLPADQTLKPAPRAAWLSYSEKTHITPLSLSSKCISCLKEYNWITVGTQCHGLMSV